MCTKQHEVICYTFGSPRTGQLPSIIEGLAHSVSGALQELASLQCCNVLLCTMPGLFLGAWQ